MMTIGDGLFDAIQMQIQLGDSIIFKNLIKQAYYIKRFDLIIDLMRFTGDFAFL